MQPSCTHLTNAGLLASQEHGGTISMTPLRWKDVGALGRTGRGDK